MENLSCFIEFAKNELETVNLSILTGQNLMLDALNQFLFGIFFMVIFTEKHCSIKDIVTKSKGFFVKTLRVNNGFSA